MDAGDPAIGVQPFLAIATLEIRAALFKHVLWPEGADGLA
jgi:hypothetical protein